MTVKKSKASTKLRAHERFRALIFKAHTCEEIYGLMRSDVLRKTPLIGSYTYSDQNLLAELALYGRFSEIPEVLFFHRWHPASTYYLWPDRSERWLWFDPSAGGRILFPHWKQLYEFLATLGRSPASVAQRARCLTHLAWWLGQCRKGLAGDVYWGVRGLMIRFIKLRMPWVRTVYRAMGTPQDPS